jgi:hypothetical protein
MLRIEVDVFSGRPNPVWMITDEDATKRLLAEIAETPDGEWHQRPRHLCSNRTT